MTKSLRLELSNDHNIMAKKKWEISEEKVEDRRNLTEKASLQGLVGPTWVCLMSALQVV